MFFPDGMREKRKAYFLPGAFFFAGFFSAETVEDFFAGFFSAETAEDFFAGFFSAVAGDFFFAGFSALAGAFFFAGFSGARFSASSWSQGDGAAGSDSGSAGVRSQSHDA